MSEIRPGAIKQFVYNALASVGSISLVGCYFIPSSEAPQHHPNYDNQGCLVPPAEAYAATQQMLDAPEEEMVTRFNYSISGKGPETDRAISLKTYQAWVSQKAAALGRTMHSFDPNDYVAEWQDPEKAWKFSTAFLGQYGIQLSLGEGMGALFGIDGDRLTNEQRRSADFAKNLMLLDQQVSKYPVEFIRDKAQQGTVVFMDGRVTDLGDIIERKVAGEAASPLHPGTIFLDYKYGGIAYDHELGHIVDVRMGCLDKPDPTLTNNNPPDTYGPPERSKTLSMEAFEEQARGKTLTMQQTNDLEKKVVTVSKYGVTDREEDVAEINKDIERGFFGRYSHGLGTSLENKFRLQLARYYTFDAATTQLIATTSYHDNPGVISGVK